MDGLALRNLDRSKRVAPTLPKVVSLFCGAGGLDLGFCNEGFRIPIAIDRSEAAVRTHQLNFPDSLGVAEDLVELGPEGVFSYVSQNVRKKSRIGIIGGLMFPPTSRH
jgi:DNA (cytosine-5)-methyltransferase 1